MNSASQKYLITGLEAALAAGEAILEVYRKPEYKTELKEDATPLTEADQAAHEIILKHLLPTGFPVLSEEGREIEYAERKGWRLFWLVDPLDGTKEFISKNGEFTVNIALIHGKKAILGILYAPLLDIVYYSDCGMGAYRLTDFSSRSKGIKAIDKLIEISEPMPLEKPDKVFRVVASRSHINHETMGYIKSLRTRHPELEMVSKGSALKFCLVAEGSADIYPRFGPTWEWDTGAGQAIAEASGCKVTLLDEKTSLSYNKENLLNPGFIVRRD